MQASALAHSRVALRCVYTDLDGTLLGRGASLFRDGEGDFTLLPARALEACHRAGVEVVIKSGRRKAQVMEEGGAPALLLEAYAGRLEPHAPWHLDRHVSHLFRGLVDTTEADELMAREGHGNLRLVD